MMTLEEMIQNAVDYERSGRKVAAALALAIVRERYESINRSDLSPDDDTWEKFRRRIPLPPQRTNELIGMMVHRSGVLRCTECGRQTLCPCGCGVPYANENKWAVVSGESTVSAMDRAIAAISANPKKSLRAIAAEIGVSHQTVKRARAKMGSGTSDVTGDVTVSTKSANREK